MRYYPFSYIELTLSNEISNKNFADKVKSATFAFG